MIFLLVKLSLKIIFFIIIFGFSWAPLLLSLIGFGNITLTDYSIYNTNWNGLSTFRDITESNGYEIKPVISSISSVNRVNEPSILVIIGPTAFYDPIASTAIIDYLNNGSSIIVADDFGSSSELLLFLGITTSFSGQLLLDAGSYDKNVSLPIITSFNSHPVFQGVSSLEFNYASALSGTGGSALAYSSSLSWLDTNANYAYDAGEQMGPFTVISTFNYGNGSLMLISDPTLFNNDMINRADNSQFAINLINWATNGDNTYLILVDEGHRGDVSTPSFFFGVILSQINWLSSHWLLAPIYPLFAIYLIRSWLPKRKKEMQITEREIKPKKSIFTTKLDWYRTSQNYNKAINILVKKLKKDLISAYNLSVFDLNEVAEKISIANPTIKIKDVIGIFQTLDIITSGKKIIADKDLFLSVFSEINKFREMVGIKK
jgi:hypothetical protein